MSEPLLIDRLKDEALAARKAQAPARHLLTTVIAEAEKVAKDDGQRLAPTDAEVIKVLKKTAKGLGELLQARPGDQKALFERQVLADYLPAPLRGVELQAAITQAAEDLGLPMAPKSQGEIMKRLEEQFPGRAEGSDVSAVLRG